jgi:hypothetical protein
VVDSLHLVSGAPKRAMGYNESKIILPLGLNRAQMKMRVRRTAYLGANEKCLLTFILDQAETYVLIGVKQIKNELGWGEKRWIGARDSLYDKCIYRGYGLINGRGSIEWKMVFDFNEFEYGFPDECQKEGITGAREISPTGRDRVRSPQQEGITCDPPARGGSSIPNVLTKTNQPLVVVVVVDDKTNSPKNQKSKSVDQEEQPGAGSQRSQIHWPCGLTVTQKQVIESTLDQLDEGEAGVSKQELIDELAGRMSSKTPVRNPVGLMRKFVSLAQEGGLTCELAEDVRATRGAHQEHQMLLDQLSNGEGRSVDQKAISGPKAAPAQSAVATLERAKLREKRSEWGKVGRSEVL